MNISAESTNISGLSEIPFELIRLNVHYAQINWEPTTSTHEDFNWNNFEAAMARLENKITRGDTITNLVVTTRSVV